jgi:hypothetical protein
MTPELLAVISLASLGLSITVAVYNWRRNAHTDTKSIWDAISLLNTDMALVKKQGDLFWGLIEQQMAKALIRPTHIELDRLLERLVRGEELTLAQERRLVEMLREVVNDKEEVPGVRAMGATILAIRLARRKAAKESVNPCD